MSDPFSEVNTIRSRAEFIELVRGLRADLQVNADQWENPFLADFLAALAAWVQDMDGYFLNRGEPPPAEPTWRLIGQMLCAAAVYE